MKQLPNACVDLVVTSPPYAVGKAYELDENGERLDIQHLLVLAWECFKQYRRIVKPGGYVVWQFGDNTFGKHEYGSEVMTTIPMAIHYWPIGHDTGFELQATRIWRKSFSKVLAGGVPFSLNHEPRPMMDYEHIWTWRLPDGKGKQGVRSHRLSRRGVWDTSKDGLAELGEVAQKGPVLGQHGAAFPIQIPLWAITLYSDEGDVVLDNFMGTGTTAVAAEQLYRNWYGIERDPKWVEFANQRIEKARLVGQQETMEI